MADSKLVKIVDSWENLVKKLAGIFFSDPLSIDNVFKELPTSGIFHDQVELFRSLYDLIELNYSGMSDYLEYMDLSSNSLNIMDVNDLLFLQNFDGDFLAG